MAKAQTTIVADGRLLGQAILRLPDEGLATVLALLEEVSLGQLLMSRAWDWATWSDGQFQRSLGEKTEILAQQPREKLVLRILGNLNETLDLEPRNYVARKDLEDNAEEIGKRAIEIQRRSDKKFTGSTLKDLVAYQLNRIFTGFGENYDDLPEDERKKALKQVREFVHGLPEEQQAKIKEELGADELTDAFMREALAKGLVAAAFATTVEIAGFSFYTGATSALAAASGAVGATLPFGAYTGLTSLIAVLSNPFFLAALLSAGGYYSWNRASQKLREGLVPIVVAQIAASGAERTEGVDPAMTQKAVLDAWSTALTSCRRERTKLIDAAADLDQKKHELADVKERAARREKAMKARDQEMQGYLADLSKLSVQRSSEIAAGAWGVELIALGRKLHELTEKLQEVESAPKSGNPVLWLRDSFAHGWESQTTGSEVKDTAQDVGKAMFELWTADKSLDDLEALAILEELGKVRNDSSRLERELDLFRSEASDLDASIKKLRTTIEEAKKEIAEAEGKYWGLEKLQ